MTSGRLIVVMLVTALSLSAPTGKTRASELETLLMPGKVSAAHAKIEADCTQCHDRADRARQPQLCVACHREIGADLLARKGLHGRMQAASAAQCKACHSEHLGRDADIVKFAREQFDHSVTNFELDGAHVSVACASCHAAGRKFRQAPSTCAACHRGVEPHEGKLGAKCQNCHATSSWAKIGFDHDKTVFPLRERHRDTACAACHFGNRYAGTPKLCVSCHAPDDVHRGERGSNCGECHTQTSWTTAKFDHAKTGFPLLGVHNRIDCQGCHTTGNFKDKLPKDCIGCHAGVDSHAGRFGKLCSNCHDSDAWKPAKFDHTRDAHLALDRAHARLDCHACHTAAVAEQKLGKECGHCHRADDVHGGRLGTNCETCHQPESWKAGIRFDHDLTNFPLVGLHVTVPCEQCHADRRFKGAPRDCNGCHRPDDVHKGRLGKECSRCHSPNGWRLWNFDHGKETGFALNGAHAKLTCEGCHRPPPDQVKLSQSCAACHVNDDVHHGQYGRQCDRCHSTISFKGALLH
jgi:hypothetical protein